MSLASDNAPHPQISSENQSQFWSEPQFSALPGRHLCGGRTERQRPVPPPFNPTRPCRHPVWDFLWEPHGSPWPRCAPTRAPRRVTSTSWCRRWRASRIRRRIRREPREKLCQPGSPCCVPANPLTSEALPPRRRGPNNRLGLYAAISLVEDQHNGGAASASSGQPQRRPRPAPAVPAHGQPSRHRYGLPVRRWHVRRRPPLRSRIHHVANCS